MRISSRIGVLVFAAGTALLGAAGPAMAADNPPPLEEEYDYPGADKIYAERGIRLKKGDGNILLTDCVSGADLLEVRSRGRDPFCFGVRGNTGYLSLELTEAFLVFSTRTHTTVADYTVNGVAGSTTVQPGGAEGIGEGSGPGKSATLMEIRVRR